MDTAEVLEFTLTATTMTTLIKSAANASKTPDQVQFKIVSDWMFNCHDRFHRERIPMSAWFQFQILSDWLFHISDWTFQISDWLHIAFIFISDCSLKNCKYIYIFQISSDWFRLASKWIAMDICRITSLVKIPRKCITNFWYKKFLNLWSKSFEPYSGQAKYNAKYLISDRCTKVPFKNINFYLRYLLTT